MTVTINSWSCIGDTDNIAMVAAGDNVSQSYQYLKIVPSADARIVSFLPPQDAPPECRWIMEIANADPTQTYSITLVGGLPAQDPPQIVLPPGKSQILLTPGLTQRLYYETGIGWCALCPGVLT